jgi:prepilin-type N-terminal cleavage/methylation domain-containing protein
MKLLRRTTSEGERGFTLAELMVVVVIVGILMAIAIPIFNKQRETAMYKQSVAMARYFIDGMEIALQEGVDDYDSSVNYVGTYAAIPGGPAAGVRVEYTIVYAPSNPNAAPSNLATQNPRMAAALNEAGLITADGQWLSGKIDDPDANTWIHAEFYAPGCTTTWPAGRCKFTGYQICVYDGRLFKWSDFDRNSNGWPDWYEGASLGLTPTQVAAEQARYVNAWNGRAAVAQSWRGGIQPRGTQCAGH